MVIYLLIEISFPENKMELSHQKKTGLIIISILIIIIIAIIAIYYYIRHKSGKISNYLIGTWLINPQTDLDKYFLPGNCFNLAYLNLPINNNSASNTVEKYSKQISNWRSKGRLFIPSFNFIHPDILVDIVKNNPSQIMDWCNSIHSVIDYDGIMFNYEPILNSSDIEKNKIYMDTLRNLVEFIDSQVEMGNYIGKRKLLFFSFGESAIMDLKSDAGKTIDEMRNIMFNVKNITVLYDWQKYSSKNAEVMIDEFMKREYKYMVKNSLFTLSGIQMNKYGSLMEIKEILKNLRGFTLWLDKTYGNPPNGIDGKFIGNKC